MTDIQFNRGAVRATDCVGRAWNLVTQQLGLYIGVTIVAGLILLVVSLIPFAGFVLSGPLLGGFYLIAVRHNDNEPVDFGMMFKGFEKFLPLMVVSLIQNIPGIALTIIQYTADLASIFGGGLMRPPPPRPAGLGASYLAAGSPDLAFSMLWAR
jgi:hypothetical protein